MTTLRGEVLVRTPVDAADSAWPPETDLRVRRLTDGRSVASGARPQSAQALSWWRGTRVALVLLDAVAVVSAMALAAAVRPDLTLSGPLFTAHLLVALFIATGWLTAVALGGGYQVRHLGTGGEEYKRVLVATFRIFGLVAIVSYAVSVELPRGFIAVALPAGAALLLLGRFVARRRIVGARARGECVHQVLVVGDGHRVEELVEALRSEPYAGFVPVAACVADPTKDRSLRCGTPVIGGLASTAEAAAVAGADIVAVAGGPTLGAAMLREIAWSLEGSGIDLVVSPALTNVAGPRISIRPVAGLPLLYVDEPRFSGGKRLAKTVIDGTAALLGLLVLAPLLLAVGAAVRLTSSGPAFFRQTRTGLDGQEFRVCKFRTMYEDAEARLAELQHQNQSDGLLFKMKDDPRITPVGRFLRRTSLDELPQLINVLFGHMSLVGPRPLPVKDSDFEGHVRRRLLVRPGITGLWQVSGRSDLSWEDAVRMDLYYVENWSISLDVLILLRTVTAVVRGSGAY